MKRFATLIALGALALTSSAAMARGMTGEERLAELTAGRVAGAPRGCISTFRDSNIEVIDRVGIAYKDGKTLWVARAVGPTSLDNDDILIVNRSLGGMLCREDVRETIDRYSGFLRSVVFLDDFVPYVRQG